jgi:SAM-dependent methyltransferase
MKKLERIMVRQINDEQQVPFTTESESFTSFLRHTDQKSVTQRAIIYGLQNYFPSLWKRVKDPGYDLNILYVGVGNGGVEIPLTKQLSEARGGIEGSIRVYCEDPSVQMREQFYVAAQEAGISALVQEYRLERLEDYHPRSVDLAIMSHVMYYVEDWDNAFLKLADSVREREGVVLVTLQSEKSDNFQIRTRFSPRVHPGTQEHYGEEITAALDRLGIRHLSYIVDAHTDVSECFQEGKLNPTVVGKHLLTFILRSPWDALRDEIKEGLAKCLSDIVENNHKQIMIFRDLYIWIPGT